MLATKVGLVDTTGTVDTQMMAAVAAALNVQVTRDLPKYWPVSASVSYLTDHKTIPQGVWPVQLVKTLPPDEGGFHMTRHNQPYAKVIVTPGSDEWAVDASHETIEMLIDPNGNRLQTSNAIEIVDGKIQDGTGRFEYLVEACDPCEADPYTYTIDGIAVSDFITPHFYDPDVTPDARYSFTGAVKKPRQLLPGGYISWVDPTTNELQQILWVDPNQPPVLRNLGSVTGGSLRLFIESKTYHKSRENREQMKPEARAKRAAYRQALVAAAEVRARHYS
ncbi:conserved hypothetical protein [Paraburkholderia piptadeniae]|uniref:Uncharacterized protein n=2 Tax=Paraburkholderia piptadeniae TaxID=1701573 RepID=A0A1N7RPT2_9BURK|nr:conserved hypothetical protein [Paraburkholderia piptadeniae]